MECFESDLSGCDGGNEKVPVFKTLSQVCDEMDAHFGAEVGTAKSCLVRRFQLRSSRGGDVDYPIWSWKPTSGTTAVVSNPARVRSKSADSTCYEWAVNVSRCKRMIPNGQKRYDVNTVLGEVGMTVKEAVSYAVNLSFRGVHNIL